MLGILWTVETILQSFCIIKNYKMYYERSLLVYYRDKNGVLLNEN